MAKDDFDINFDFDQEYDFDPKILSGDGEYDGDIDLSEFSDEELGLSSQDAGEIPDDSGDFDLDDIDGFLEDDAPAAGEDAGDIPDDVPSFIQRNHASYFDMNGYGATPEISQDMTPSQLDEEPEPLPEEPPVEEPQPEEPQDYDPSAESPEEPAPKRERRRRPPKPAKEKKPAAPNLFTKFFDLYFAPVLNKGLPEEPQDPNNPRRRRKKSKLQIFKEVYLPAIVVCLCVILVLSFGIGAMSSAIQQHKLDKVAEQSRLDASVSAKDQQAIDAQNALTQAAKLAEGYNYDDAITVLDNFLATLDDNNAYPNLTAQRSEYLTLKNQLVVHQDPALIPNLSFHVLIQDMAKAKLDPQVGGLYNRNFVTTSEFSKILGELYNNNYVLVDFNSFTTNNGGTILPKNIALPEGKKPVMITQTLVNYFAYMTDLDKNGEPDPGGTGFAYRLVVTDSGDIKAEYMDGSGSPQVGDYDLVPILETFLKEHPDFSYKGARATLAVTGEEGIFGYRINSSYTADRSQSYRDEQIAGAKKLVEALRAKGYTLACNSYGNRDYKKDNANQIQNDLQQWTQQITPVIGNVDVFVFARESDLTDYAGNAFNIMTTSGFRYFVSNSKSPSTEVNSTYVRQKRLMVTGNSMAWQQDMFNGIFDPNSVIDSATRGQVPN